MNERKYIKWNHKVSLYDILVKHKMSRIAVAVYLEEERQKKIRERQEKAQRMLFNGYREEPND